MLVVKVRPFEEDTSEVEASATQEVKLLKAVNIGRVTKDASVVRPGRRGLAKRLL